MKIAIAQCAPALGAMKRNLEMHREWIAKAQATGASLVRPRLRSRTSACT